MELRTASGPKDVKTYDTTRLRDEFLIQNLFNADDIKYIYSHIDRICGGDAFSSGIIHGLLKDFEHPKYALKFGLATSVLKHTVYGDASTLSEEAVTEFIESNGNAAVQR